MSANKINVFKEERGLNQQKNILTIGGVHNRKGQEWIIRAMPKVLLSVPNAHYYCIGIGLIKEKLEKVVKELNLIENIHFLGRLPDEEMLQWLKACDVFGMTSVHYQIGDFEGFGIAIIEAALCAKSVVVSDTSGVTEAVVDRETGLIIREKDSVDISNKICELLQNDELRIKIGNNAFKRASELYTWEVIIKQYDKVLTELID